jgi:hypothetical protein
MIEETEQRKGKAAEMSEKVLCIQRKGKTPNIDKKQNNEDHSEANKFQG